MSVETNKTEDRIAKEKEAVKAMTGARTAMSEAINRIERLEKTLGAVRFKIKKIGDGFSGDIHMRVYENGDYKVRPLSALFDEIDSDIKNVL